MYQAAQLTPADYFLKILIVLAYVGAFYYFEPFKIGEGLGGR